MVAETGHGAIREIFIAPVIGDVPARQLGVFLGCGIIFAIAWISARWMGAHTRRAQWQAGALWVVLTLAFEITLGRFLGMSWSRILSDYNLARGGLMIFGLAFMLMAPTIAASLRFGRKDPR